MQTDYYLNDEGQLQIWAHYALTQTPQGDEITVVINAECNIGPDKESLYGDWQPFVCFYRQPRRRFGARGRPPGRARRSTTWARA